MSKRQELSQQQKLFCEYYIVDMNATQAALKAGYGNDGVKYDSAGVAGHRLLKQDKIKRYIDYLLDSKRDEIDITRAEVINGIKKIAYDESINPNIRLNAFSKLGDYLQLFNKQPQVVVNNTVTNLVEDMSDEEIEKELARLERLEKGEYSG